MYPIVVILAGYLIVNFIGYFEFKEEQGGTDNNLVTAFTFIGLTYALGFIFMILPNLYLELLGKASNLRADFCLADSKI